MTTLVRAGAKKLIAQAMEAEEAKLMAMYVDQQDETGRAIVVRSGHHPARDIQAGIGTVAVQDPKVRSRRGNTGHSVPP